MAPTKKMSWKFPLKNFIFLKIETVFVAFLAVIVFLLSFQKGWFYAVVTTVIFLGVYLFVSYMVQKIRKVEEKYSLTNTHFQVTRKTRQRVHTEKVPLEEIKTHKLSKNFLGGYLLTQAKKKHLLFFNSKDELDKFDKHIQKHYKSRNKKRVTKKRVVKKVVRKKAVKRRKK